MRAMLLWALLLMAEPPDARALLERAIDATKQQKPERSRYFGREDVQVFRVEGEKRKRLSWNTYEAMILDGQIRFKRTARNGKPIPAHKQQLQPVNQRWGLRFEQMLDHHRLRVTGEEQIGGRPAWILQADLKDDAPLPIKLDDLALLGSARIWIDQVSGIDLQTRLLTLRPFRGLERGSLIETNLTKVDNVFVAARAFIRIPTPRGATETIQTYSAYKRFSSDVTIRFEADPPSLP